MEQSWRATDASRLGVVVMKNTHTHTQSHSEYPRTQAEERKRIAAARAGFYLVGFQNSEQGGAGAAAERETFENQQKVKKNGHLTVRWAKRKWGRVLCGCGRGLAGVVLPMGDYGTKHVALAVFHMVPRVPSHKTPHTVSWLSSGLAAGEIARGGADCSSFTR